MEATQPVVETIFRKLGGREVLGQKVTSEADLPASFIVAFPCEPSSMSNAVASPTKRSGDLSSRSGRRGIGRASDNR